MAPSTSFAATAQAQIAQAGGFPSAYADFAQHTLGAMQETMQSAGEGGLTSAHDVAEAVFRAATDPECPMTLPAGADAVAWSQGG